MPCASHRKRAVVRLNQLPDALVQATAIEVVSILEVAVRANVAGDGRMEERHIERERERSSRAGLAPRRGELTFQTYPV